MKTNQEEIVVNADGTMLLSEEIYDQIAALGDPTTIIIGWIQDAIDNKPRKR